jgi:hypothetical protein
VEVHPVEDKGTLARLAMNSGKLIDVLGDDETWVSIVDKLHEVSLDGEDTDVAELCTIYYVFGAPEPAVKRLEQAPKLEGQHSTAIDDIVKFLENFMMRNGQWPYINRQKWYQERKYVIAIDVNYYPDRRAYQSFPIFHKDSGGNNIFVSLIFDNKAPIAATEWFWDLEKPGKERAKWQEPLLPALYLAELDAARNDLRKGVDLTSDVSGGLSKAPYTYVSWVDDLVWHSTPSTGQRLEVSIDIAKGAYDALDSTLEASFQSDYPDAPILGVELLASMADCPGTELGEWLRKNSESVSNIYDPAVYIAAWKALYSRQKSGGKDQYDRDVEIRVKSGSWRITRVKGEANAQDPRLELSRAIHEPAVRLSKLRRTNSWPDIQKQLLEQAGMDDKPRSFLRTWVRILRITDKEVPLKLQQ